MAESGPGGGSVSGDGCVYPICSVTLDGPGAEGLSPDDAASGFSSMARTTGYTATAAARLVLAGAFDRKGICPPEYLGAAPGCFERILADVDVNGARTESTFTRVQPSFRLSLRNPVDLAEIAYDRRRITPEALRDSINAPVRHPTTGEMIPDVFTCTSMKVH